mmetsp:Transcript_13934/g.46155  ORF Transcript_13934/g.46155 Transcript_13934/m.46155 type:complete len:201 (+) Transcript_13934:749-1351(+)
MVGTSQSLCRPGGVKAGPGWASLRQSRQFTARRVAIAWTTPQGRTTHPPRDQGRCPLTCRTCHCKMSRVCRPCRGAPRRCEWRRRGGPRKGPSRGARAWPASCASPRGLCRFWAPWWMRTTTRRTTSGWWSGTKEAETVAEKGVGMKISPPAKKREGTRPGTRRGACVPKTRAWKPWYPRKPPFKPRKRTPEPPPPRDPR